jgi:hypothetical protein
MRATMGSLSSERGVALILALMALLLLSAIGLALILLTSTEMLIASNFRDSQEASYTADAAAERGIDELLARPDWGAVLAGTERSTFVDGPPAGERAIPGGGVVNLGATVNRANCGQAAGCSTAEMDAVTSDRPWGPNNPRYALFGYGPAGARAGTAGRAPRVYVVLMVADDPSENDGDPLRDGATEDNPGRGIITLRSEAFGASGAHTVLEATVRRADTNTAERGYAGQQGGGEANRRAAGSGLAAGSPPSRTEIALAPDRR